MVREKRAGVDGRVALTPGAVVEGALSLAGSGGLEAVTIRRLAGELGVTPMALYWHFRGKDGLLDAMAAAFYERIDLELDASASWQKQLRALLLSVVEVLRAHPSAAVLISTRTVRSGGSLRATETALGILARGGFSPAEATQIVRHALSTVTSLVATTVAPASAEDPGELADSRRQARVFLGSLPPERYPRIVEAAGPLSECEDADAYLDFGLDLLLAGIEAMAERRR